MVLTFMAESFKESYIIQTKDIGDLLLLLQKLQVLSGISEQQVLSPKGCWTEEFKSGSFLSFMPKEALGQEKHF